MSYIKTEEIIRDKINIVKSKIDLDKWDMYYITFSLKNGGQRIVRAFTSKGAFPDFKSEELNDILERSNHDSIQSIIDDFFIKRLINQDGLMATQGKDDFIFLDGKLFFNGKIVHLNKREENGKTVGENFEINSKNLQIKVKAAELKSQRTQANQSQADQFRHSKKSKPQVPNSNNISGNNKKGKTYVFSDVHGMYGSYKEAMSKMTPNDTVIILGDVIDRGNGGIKILLDIIERQKDRQNNPEIIFMMGNHEMQFLQTLARGIKHKIRGNDWDTICKYMEADRELRGYSTEDLKKSFAKPWVLQKNKYLNEYNKLKTDKGLSDLAAENIYIWLELNHGRSTFNNFGIIGKGSEGEKTAEIYNFLRNAYVVLPKTIKDKDYLFVHAMPPQDDEMLNTMKKTKKGYKFSDLTSYSDYNKCLFMLQERDEKTYLQARKAGFHRTICGHTPGSFKRDDKEGYIRIDCGCAYALDGIWGSNLALYCVDDDTVQYIDAKEQEWDGEQL